MPVNDSDLYIKTLEKKLQQNFTAPWLAPKQFTEHQELVTQLSDRLSDELRSYSLEPTHPNLLKLVTTCEQLKAIGFHPAIIGEKKIPNGIYIIREDVWLKIQQAKEEKNLCQTPNPPISS